MTTTPANHERPGKTRTLTEPQWFAKSHCHVRWLVALEAEKTRLESRIEEARDAQTDHQIILDRLEAIAHRFMLISRVMRRHLERAPAELLPLVRDVYDFTEQ